MKQPSNVGIQLILFIFCGFLGSCFLFSDDPPAETDNLTGMYEGTYSWQTNTSGTMDVQIELTQHGSSLSGTASYNDDKTSLSGTVEGDNATIQICGTSLITYNVFSGTVVGNRISGTTLNGEDSSAPTGPSGTFFLDRYSDAVDTPYKLAVYGPTARSISEKPSDKMYVVEVQNSEGQPVKAVNEMNVILSGNGNGDFFRNENYSVPLSSVVIAEGELSQVFYFKDDIVETTSILAHDNGGGVVDGSLSVQFVNAGGGIFCNLDGSPAEFNQDAACEKINNNIYGVFFAVSGYDSAHNFLQFFFVAGDPGTNSCINMYYQTAGGKQWGAGGSIGGICSVEISETEWVGAPISGTFSGSLVSQFGGASGTRIIEGGEFSVIWKP